MLGATTAVLALGVAALLFRSPERGVVPSGEPLRQLEPTLARLRPLPAQSEQRARPVHTEVTVFRAGDAAAAEAPLAAAKPDPPEPEAEPTPSAEVAASTRQQLKRDAERALSNVEVTVYGTGWCGVCRRATTWLRASGIPFREIDIERSESGRQRMRQLNPEGSVPTIDVDGEVMVGFSPEAMGRALGEAVQKRLARR